MWARRTVLLASFVLAVAHGASAQVAAERIAAGFDRPLALVADPRDPAVLFVVEQAGLVRVLRDRQIAATPFLDLRSVVSSDGERGLLGLAFESAPPVALVQLDPAVPRPGRSVPLGDLRGRLTVPRPPPTPGNAVADRFFVNFTNRDGHTVIARFRRTAGNPLVAEAASRRDLVWPDGRSFIEQPFSNHNGGHLLFGPDGYLYVGMGDGGSGGDPMHRAQDPTSLLGKMLRLDVRVADDDPRGYRVPADNPFVDGVPVAALHEIWAFGLRNPWRYNFDDPVRGGSGALYIADVGQGQREEVNYQPQGSGGLNYGWRLREGTLVYDERRAAAYGPLTAPVHEYGRTEGQSITGGFVYRGRALDPSLAGRYFYADFVAGRVFSLGLRQAGETVQVVDVREHTSALGGRAGLGVLSSFGIDAAGELYLLNHSAGDVLKIVPQLSLVPSAPGHVRLRADAEAVLVTWVPAPDGVTPVEYIVEASSEEDLLPTRTVSKTSGHESRVDLQNEERCLRVRAVGRSGVGPPSPLVCLP